MTLNNNVILLFFKDTVFDSYVPYDRYIRRALRVIYDRFRTTQKTSGFEVWCQLLQQALTEQGYEVHLNNYRLARKNPDHPVGLVGYPRLLEGWTLPNPAILGPALLNHPLQNPTLMRDPRFRKYLVTCDWMYMQFAPVYGSSKVACWFAGMDLDKWPDTQHEQKSVDVLLYDKIRWNREYYEPQLLNEVKAVLIKRGLSYETIRYKHYVHEMYREQLKRARSMIFLCEHETQGMAYQEALASNVPVLAWDQGKWLDPNRPKYSSVPIPASSVPYFSDIYCGDRFQSAEAFEHAFERFWGRLDTYQPRNFVKHSLSFQESAASYAAVYFAEMKRTQTPEKSQTNKNTTF